MKRPFQAHLWLGLALVGGLAALFRLTDLDRAWSGLFWQASEPHWPLHDWGPFRWLQKYGEWPGRLLGAGSLLGLVASHVVPSQAARRKAFLFLSLVFLLGPGLLVNVLGKSLAGRPRPYSVVDFGGTHAFVPAFGLGDGPRRFGLAVGDEYKSFLSGHCSMAFLFMALGFILPGRKGLVAMVLGMDFGLLMGVARVAQGDHFPSDALLCGALLFTLSAWLASRILEPVRSET